MLAPDVRSGCSLCDSSRMNILDLNSIGYLSFPCKIARIFAMTIVTFVILKLPKSVLLPPTVQRASQHLLDQRGHVGKLVTIERNRFEASVIWSRFPAGHGLERKD